MSIKKRFPGTPKPWSVRVYKGRNDAGQPQYATKRCTTREEAKHEERRLEGEVAKGQHDPDRLDSIPGTVGELLDHWLEVAPHSPSNAESTASIVRCHLKPKLGNIALKDLTRSMLDRHFARLTRTDGKPMSEHTRVRVFRCLHAALEMAVEDEWIDKNPATKLNQRPKQPKPEPKPTDVDTIQKLLDTLDPTDEEPGRAYRWAQLRLYIRLLAATGGRRGEVLALRWNSFPGGNEVVIETSVKIGNGTHYVGPTKTGKLRRIALDDDTVLALIDWRERQIANADYWGEKLVKDPFLFSAEVDGSTPYYPRAMSMRLERAAKRAGVTVTAHQFRHWHVTQLLAQGADLKTISLRVGHDRMTTTDQIYGAFVPARDQAAAAIIGGLLE